MRAAAPDPTAITAEALLDRLVSFDTVSAHGNRPLIEWVAAYLQGFGIAPTILAAPDDPRKANLLASIGPAVPGGIVLSGHTDVVPVTEQVWESDPFTLTRRNGRLYGRGTADMKGFLAVVLALVPDWVRAPLSRPIHLAFSYDEEVGCLGAPALVDRLIDTVPSPAFVIVGEPTRLHPVNAHKGVHGFQTRITGKDVHSSAPHQGASAIVHAARLVGHLDALQQAAKAAADPASPFDPPYSTINIGRIDGGTALNITPRRCTFVWDYRYLPGEDAEATIRSVHDHVAQVALPALRAEYPDGQITLDRLCLVPALQPDPDGPAETFARQITGANAAGTVAFGTEGGLFQRAGLSTVVLGPGDIDQAHQPDEYIEVDQLRDGEALFRRIGETLTT